jgi:hypothetical protein
MIKLAEIENALLDAVKAAMPYLGDSVFTAATEHFDSDGQIIAPVPAALSIYQGGAARPLGTSARANDFRPRFEVAAGTYNLRGTVEAQQGDPSIGESGAYDLLDDLRGLAGTKLVFNSGSGLLVFVGDRLLQFSAEGIWYAAMFEVKTHFVNG